MKRSKIVLLAALVTVLGSVLVGPAAQGAGGKAKSGPTVVGTDPAGDWGCNQDCQLAPMGDVLGQDLTEASIGMGDPGIVNFQLKVNKLPPSGGVPEFSRYTWEFMVDGSAMQLSGGFTEYLRGICNPTYNPMICPPPRDPGMSPFFIRVGGCTVGGPCEEVGKVNATFDAATGTITIPVPMEVLKAKPGSKITGGSSLFGGTIYAAPAAVITNATMPADTITVLKTFVVPRGKK